MSLERELILGSVEEDNTQRAFFRIHPFMTIEGPAAETAKALWPDEGCLRVVPDRAEQHTFKERMRQLNGWCVIDLAAFAPDANKIRTNKNYHPDRGEVNQYIVYSDTVHAVPENIYYELLAGDVADVAALAEKAVTTCFMIQQGDTMYGPVSKAEPKEPTPAPEMEAVAFTAADYQGTEHTILCVGSELEEHKKANPPAERKQPAHAEKAAPEQEAPVPAPVPEKQEDKELKIGEKLEILDQTKDFQETLETLNQPVSNAANLLKQEVPEQQPEQPVQTDARLNGTPLMRAPLRTSVAQPKNKLQEVIYSQCRVSRNEPPAEELPNGTAMREVTNPVVEACRAMRQAWGSTANRDQLVDFLISLDGMLPKLEPKTRRAMGPTMLQRAVQSHLEDLEAERLALLVQLDQARTDLEEYRKKVLSEVNGKTAEELKQKETELEKLKQSLAAMQEENNALLQTREQLTAQVQNLRETSMQEAMRLLTQLGLPMQSNETLLRMVPQCGEVLSEEALLKRVELVCRSVGYAYNRNQALAITIAVAVSKRIGISTDTPAAVISMLKNLAAQLGWESGMAVQVDREQRPVVVEAPANGTPAVLISMLQSYAPLKGACKVILTKTAQLQSGTAAYAAGQWPVYTAGTMRSVLPVEAGKVTPLAAASLTGLLEGHTEVPRETVINVLSPMLNLIPPLGGEALGDVCRFVSAAAALMEGGLMAACDWAIALWVMPALPRTAAMVEKARLLLAEYPISAALL